MESSNPPAPPERIIRNAAHFFQREAAATAAALNGANAGNCDDFPEHEAEQLACIDQILDAIDNTEGEREGEEHQWTEETRLLVATETKKLLDNFVTAEEDVRSDRGLVGAKKSVKTAACIEDQQVRNRGGRTIPDFRPSIPAAPMAAPPISLSSAPPTSPPQSLPALPRSTRQQIFGNPTRALQTGPAPPVATPPAARHAASTSNPIPSNK
ncbi:hypothetical protein QBC45DRAFT_464709 [Copromyces sp. CBS 386.78]|nr:hypothetical protein QBC45DRAFT_464709 [Copromyces sp. CBS 386.78]